MPCFREPLWPLVMENKLLGQQCNRKTSWEVRTLIQDDRIVVWTDWQPWSGKNWSWLAWDLLVRFADSLDVREREAAR